METKKITSTLYFILSMCYHSETHHVIKCNWKRLQISRFSSHSDFRVMRWYIGICPDPDRILTRKNQKTSFMKKNLSTRCENSLFCNLSIWVQKLVLAPYYESRIEYRIRTWRLNRVWIDIQNTRSLLVFQNIIKQ